MRSRWGLRRWGLQQQQDEPATDGNDQSEVVTTDACSRRPVTTYAITCKKACPPDAVHTLVEYAAAWPEGVECALSSLIKA